MEATGYCWRCGKVIEGFIENLSKDLFCCKKHEEQYKRMQERGIRKGKKAGYGIAGSTH